MTKTSVTLPTLGRWITAVLLLAAFGAGIAVNRLIWTADGRVGASSSMTDLESFTVLQQTWDLIHDQYVDGESVDEHGHGFFARCLQHEVDHLDGYLYLDRLERSVRKKAMRAIRDQL